MKVADTSHSLTAEQGKNLQRFFEILANVERRKVSTYKVRSDTLPIEQATACIDKLILKLREQVVAAEVSAQLGKIGTANKRIRLKSWQWAIDADSRNSGVLLSLRGPIGEEHIDSIITRPSAFSTFNDYWKFLTSIMPTGNLETATVTRIDLAVDIPTDLKKVLRSFDIKNKRLGFQYHDQGGARTGMTIGKGLERVVIYDKSKRHGLDEVEARIEFQLSGNKRPCLAVSDLSKKLTEEIKAFHNTELLEVSPIDDSLFSESQKDRQKTFSAQLDREGYYSVRKANNQANNFERDFGRLFVVQPYEIQLQDIFKKSMQSYFEVKNGRE